MNFFQNISQWAMAAIISVFGVGVAGIGLYLLLKRKFLLALSYVILVGIASAFIFNGTTIGQNLGNFFTQLLN